MDTSITEKTYPIESKWLYKTLLSVLPSLFFVIPGVVIFTIMDYDPTNGVALGYRYFFWFFAYLVIYVFIGFGSFFVNYLRRSNFHYILDEKYITIRQGVITKQERHIPYSVIQDLFVKQDLIDRFLGLASFALENASQGGFNGIQNNNSYGMYGSSKRKNRTEVIGSTGNLVGFPGLKKENAELLKQAILKKMKETLSDDSQSGL